MNARTLSFDYAGMAIEEIHNVERADRHSARRLEFTKQAASIIPVWMSAWVGQKFADFLDRKAQTLIKHAVFLEGAAYNLTEQISVTCVMPTDELLEVINGFKPKLYDAIRSCDHAVKFFKDRNPKSPTSVAFQKVKLALEQNLSATLLLHAVASGSSISGVLMPYKGASTWDEAVEQQQVAFNAVRARIRSGDTSDIDAELLVLADEALIATGSRDLKQDSSWVKRMSGNSIH
jgi:hypothetical protein